MGQPANEAARMPWDHDPAGDDVFLVLQPGWGEIEPAAPRIEKPARQSPWFWPVVLAVAVGLVAAAAATYANFAAGASPGAATTGLPVPSLDFNVGRSHCR